MSRNWFAIGPRTGCEGISRLPASFEPAEKRGRSRLIGLTKGGRNAKLHVVCDSRGRPVQMYLSAGQTSDCTGAAGLLAGMPRAKVLLSDRGYDADLLRNIWIYKDITP